MNNIAKEFIEDHLDIIDDNEWIEFFNDVYTDLDEDEAEEVIQILKEALDPEIIEENQMVAFWRRFDEITDLKRFSDVSITDILGEYENYYGISYIDARTILLEHPDLDWKYKRGEYVLEAEIR